MQKKKVEVIVYYQDLIGPFMEAFKTNSIFATPKEENIPDGISKRMSLCRAYYELKNFDLIIRCIEDILPPEAQGVPYSNKRNAEEIYELLSGYIKYDALDLVISFDSAGSMPKLEEKANGGTVNGCVYIGGQYFMFDGKKYDPSSVSKLKPYVYSISNINDEIFDILSEEEKKQIALQFMTPPNMPADPLIFNLNKNYSCLSYVNVFDDAVFDIVDQIALKQTENIFKDTEEVVSIESIHGVVNMAAIKAEEELNKKIKTLFISAIEDRFKKFSEDVDSEGKQEAAASFNAGIAAAAFFEKLDSNMTNSEITYF